MKEIFFVGDFYSNTGPANVNKNLKKVLNKKAYYSLSSNNFFRIIELFLKTIFSKSICFCSFSKIDYYGLILCKLLRKKTYYLMHGYLKIEGELNNCVNEKKIKLEEFILKNVDVIFCVSQKFMEIMKSLNLNVDLDYVNNGIDWEYMLNVKNISKDKNIIMSTGGTMARKNNLIVCKAIEKIYKENKNIKYYIIGPIGNDKKILDKYKFVRYYETIPYNQCLELMKKSNIYIQNSTFETFGLAPVEALACGCSILLSKNIGASCIMDLKDEDIICNPNDENEIFYKLKNIINYSNNDRIMKSIDKSKTSISFSANNLFNKIMEYNRIKRR